MYQTAEGGRCVFVKFTVCDGPAAFFTKARRHNTTTTTTSRVKKGRTSFFKNPSLLVQLTHIHKMRRKEKRTDIKSGRPPATPPAL